nr:reverse transcriptase domain-containing protein [Tanacetum cinerariifolium]
LEPPPPGAIISDRGTQVCNDQFPKVMLKYGVTHRLGKACAQNVKNQSKTEQYQTQDWKSTAKAESTGIFLKQNQAMKPKSQKIQSSGSILANYQKLSQ